MPDDRPTLGVRAVFDDSQASQAVRRYMKLMQRIDSTLEKFAARSVKTGWKVDRAFHQAEESAKSFDKVMQATSARYHGVTSQMVKDIQAFQTAQAAALRAAFTGRHRFGLAAALATAGGAGVGGGMPSPAGMAAQTAAAQRLQRYTVRVQQAQTATAGLGAAVSQTGMLFMPFANQVQRGELSTMNLMGTMRRLRWEFITTMFFMRTAWRIGKTVYDEMEEAAEARGVIQGVQAMSRAYGVASGAIIRSMMEISEGTMTARQIMSAVQQAILVDQGRFSSEYVRMWESARVVAAVSGADIEKVYVGLIAALDEASAETGDAVAPVLQLESAMERYAMQSGRTVDALSEQERVQVILNQTYERTNELMEAGAQDAIDATTAFDQVKSSVGDMVDAFMVAAGFIDTSSEGMERYSRMTKSAVTWSQRLGAATAAVNLLLEIQHGGFVDYTSAWHIAADVVQRYNSALAVAEEQLGDFHGELERGVSSFGEWRDAALEARMEAIDRMGAQLERAFDAIASYNRRVARANRTYQTRLTRLERDYRGDLERIDRRYDRNRERAIRNFNDRIARLQKDSSDRTAEAIERHNLQMLHNQQRYDMARVQSERLYQYERGVLVAEGDVLAIEDLDARHALEEQSREENFRLQQQQAEQMFQLQLKFMQQANREQMAELRRSLQDELAEIEERRREEKAERDLRHQEQLTDAELAHQEQLESLRESLNDQLILIGRGMQKQVEEWDEGYDTVIDLIEQALGPGGRADLVIQGFIDRWQNITIPIRTYVQTGTFPGGGGGGIPSGLPIWHPARRYIGGRQYGDDFIASTPTSLTVGEAPERVSIQPLATMGGIMIHRWGGGGIPVQGTGDFAGMDLSAIGDAIAQGLMAEMTGNVHGYRGQRGY